jgi:hypothetical protein
MDNVEDHSDSLVYGFNFCLENCRIFKTHETPKKCPITLKLDNDKRYLNHWQNFMQISEKSSNNFLWPYAYTYMKETVGSVYMFMVLEELKSRLYQITTLFKNPKSALKY